MIDLDKLSKEIKKFNIKITEKDILNFLQIEKRWPINYLSSQPSVEIINNLGLNSNRDMFNQEGYLDYIKWKNFYDLGYTTIISNVLDLNEDLRHLNNKIIQKQLGSKVNGNFYFSKPGQLPSLLEHKHNYSVIVKQIYGEGYWKINKKEVILKPQETVLIPAGCLHQVFKVLENRLSLTINI